MRRTFCRSKLRSSKQFMLYMLCAERKGNTVMVFSPRKIRKRDSRPGCVLLPDWVTSLWFFQVSHIFQLKLNMQTISQEDNNNKACSRKNFVEKLSQNNRNSLRTLPHAWANEKWFILSKKSPQSSLLPLQISTLVRIPNLLHKFV